LKPHLSPALPRTGIGQEYWQVKFERVTLKASLISPALGKPAPDQTRLLAGAQMKGRPKLGGSPSLPEDLTANPKEGAPRFIDKQNILHTGREGGNFLYFEQS